MPYIMLHDEDAPAKDVLFELPINNPQVIAGVVTVTYDRVIASGGGDMHVFSNETLEKIRRIKSQNGHVSLDVLWVGHGITNPKFPQGAPVSRRDLGGIRIAGRTFTEVIKICNPTRVVFFTCMAAKWIDRVKHQVIPAELGEQITIYASEKTIPIFCRELLYRFLAGNGSEPFLNAKEIKR